MVLLEDLPENLINEPVLLTGCVAGAVLKEEYLKLLKRAGFSIKILGENPNLNKEH